MYVPLAATACNETEGNFTLNIDDFDFDRTAQAVFVMNPSMGKENLNYQSWEDFRSFMVSMAYTYMHKSNSFSTGGFCLTAYDQQNGERMVRASVCGSLACSYLFPKL
jgi:hypothetical protein